MPLSQFAIGGRDAIVTSEISISAHATLEAHVGTGGLDEEDVKMEALKDNDPAIVREALRCVWLKIHGVSCGETPVKNNNAYFYLPAVLDRQQKELMGAGKCKVNPLLDINDKLKAVRNEWQKERKEDRYKEGPRRGERKNFLWKGLDEKGNQQEDFAKKQVQALIGEFEEMESGDNKVVQGSKSGSDNYISQNKDFLLKNEGMTELKVFEKVKHGQAFIDNYVTRILAHDVAEPLSGEAQTRERNCHRSTMQRYLMMFTLHCTGSEKPWMMFTNVYPGFNPPSFLHKFDIKASRDMGDDCHNSGKKDQVKDPEWQGIAGSKALGYLGDYMSLYKEPVTDEECQASSLAFLHGKDFVGEVDPSQAGFKSRKVCFMQALHLDLRLLGKYKLIDYSLLVTTQYYDAERHDDMLDKYNNVLLLQDLYGAKLLMTIGLIDLLKDYENDKGVQFQSYVGYKVNKSGYSVSRFKSIFGQDKYEDYPFYLFCLGVHMLDPKCQARDRRQLQLFAGCGRGDNPEIAFRNPNEKLSNDAKAKMQVYLEENDFCDLVNSCQATLEMPATKYNLAECELKACQRLKIDSGAKYPKRCFHDAVSGIAPVWKQLLHKFKRPCELKTD